jgi:hypothetical protein
VLQNDALENTDFDIFLKLLWKNERFAKPINT